MNLMILNIINAGQHRSHANINPNITILCASIKIDRSVFFDSISEYIFKTTYLVNSILYNKEIQENTNPIMT